MFLRRLFVMAAGLVGWILYYFGKDKAEADALYLLKEQVDLHRLGERILDLQNKAVLLMGKVQSYMEAAATPEEKKVLQQVCQELQESTELQKDIREQLESRLFLLEREARKKKKKRGPLKVIPPEEA